MERQLNRRQALGAAGAAGAALLAARTGLPGAIGRLADAAPAAAAASCATLTPALTEGPYWIDDMLHRADVVANSAAARSRPSERQVGVPLTLEIDLLAADGCTALNGAHVDIWHANALGVYSGEAAQGAGGGTTTTDTSGQDFLRGYQVSGMDAGAGPAPVDGRVSFRTIWPGWYAGRAIHIHVRVRTYSAGSTVATDYTTQVFFSDAANDHVLSGAAPYRARTPADNPTSDESDGVLTSAARATNVVPVSGSIAAGYRARFSVVLAGVKATASAARSAGSLRDATLRSVRVTRAASGARSVVLSLENGTGLTAQATILRGATSLARASGRLGAGLQTLHVSLPARAPAGRATLELTLESPAGGSRRLIRSLRLPPSGG